jgi:hypothetical protein
MPEHTVTSAALYLKERGYTVGRGRIGGRGAPVADTIRRWCERGKIKARQVGRIWLIDQAVLDQLIELAPTNSPTNDKSGQVSDDA